jgi:hypothetical protein
VKRCQNISINSCCEEALGEASFKKKAFTEKQEHNPTNKEKCTGRRILTSVNFHSLFTKINLVLQIPPLSHRGKAFREL